MSLFVMMLAAQLLILAPFLSAFILLVPCMDRMVSKNKMPAARLQIFQIFLCLVSYSSLKAGSRVIFVLAAEER